MNTISSQSSVSVSSLSRTPDWRRLPVKAQSTDPSQKVGATIAYSIEPAWYVMIRGEATRGGQATLELNKEKFQITIAPKQSAGATAQLFKSALTARGYAIEVIGKEKPTPAKLAVLKAQLAQKERLKREGRLTEVALYRLNTEIDMLKSQIDNQGYFDLIVHAPK